MKKRLDRAQVSALVLTALLFTAMIGYFVGKRNPDAVYTVSVQRQASEADVMRGGARPTKNVDSPDDALEQDGENPETDGIDVSRSIQEELININTAGIEELKQLHGIGDVLASRIIEYRTEYGPFEHISDIMNVRGIGTAVYEKIETKICIEN